MSSQLHKSLSNVCPKAFTGCAEYDHWEPSAKCVTSHGSTCQQNKPKTCRECAYFNRYSQPCKLGLFSRAQTSACSQAVSRKELIQRGY
ncbi:MAG: hypothetical protein WC325_11185 [Candidatus Bathyarchaeia archaeon]